MSAILSAMLLVPVAWSAATEPDTPAGVVSNFVLQVCALATNHTALAGFQAFAQRRETPSLVEYQQGIKPFAVCLDGNAAPAVAKRRIRSSDCAPNGMFLQFVLDDGTNERQAPLETVTCFPNLKLTLYADVVLWENAPAELKQKLDAIVARHKAMLSALERQAANPVSEAAECQVCDPVR